MTPNVAAYYPRTPLTPDQRAVFDAHVWFAGWYVRMAGDPRVARLRRDGHDDDMLVQIALCRLAYAARSWKPGRAKFTTYAGRAFRGAFTAALRGTHKRRMAGVRGTLTGYDAAFPEWLVARREEDAPEPVPFTYADALAGVAGLPAPLREVMELKYGLNGAKPHTFYQIECRTGVKDSTLRMRHKRALALLRKQLCPS